MFDALFAAVAALLDFFYRLQPSYGIAITLLTVTVHLLAFPLTAKSVRSMQAMGRLQPELYKIRQRYPNDRQKQHEASLELFRTAGVSPLSGCLPALLQMPVFIVLYQVINGLTRRGSGGNFDPKYLADDSVLRQALETNGGEMMSFGIDLARTVGGAVQEGWLLAIPAMLLVGAVIGTAYLAQRQITRRNPHPTSAADAGGGDREQAAAQMMQRATRWLPLSYLFIGLVAPAGVVLYLLVSNLVRLGQQTLLRRFARE